MGERSVMKSGDKVRIRHKDSGLTYSLTLKGSYWLISDGDGVAPVPDQILYGDTLEEVLGSINCELVKGKKK